MNKIELFKSKMLEALLRNDLENISKVFYEELECPFNITDEFYHVIVQIPKQPIDDLIWDSYLKDNTLPTEIIKLLNDNRLIEKGYNENKPYIIEDKSLGGYPRVTSAIHLDGKIFGYLTVYYLEKDIPTTDLHLIEITSQTLALYFSRNTSDFSSVQNIYELMINQLFLELINNKEELERWQSILPKKIEGECVIVCADSPSSKGIHLLQKLCNEIKIHFQYPKCTVFRNRLYVLVDDFKSNNGKSMFTRILSMLESYGLKLGISFCFSNLLETRTYRKQAEFAADFGISNTINYFSDNVLEIVVKQTNENRSVFTHSAFDLLKRFDQENKTDYYKTLISYLKNFGRQNGIEQELKVHRNTVHNRLTMIEKIVGCSLDDAYTFCHLYLSFIMAETVQNAQQDD